LKKEKDTLPKEKDTLPKETTNNPEDEEEDLLYTHKAEDRGNTMHWNNAFCRKPGH